jgi:hypothetical protein
MEQSPYSEANNNSTKNEISRYILNPKVYYRVYKSPPLGPILSYLKSRQIIIYYLLRSHFKIIIHYTSRAEQAGI